MRERIFDIALAIFFASFLLAQIYQLHRRAHWPKTAAKIPIPYGGWIIAAILALVFLLFVFLLSRDPLKGPY